MRLRSSSRATARQVPWAEAGGLEVEPWRSRPGLRVPAAPPGATARVSDGGGGGIMVDAGVPLHASCWMPRGVPAGAAQQGGASSSSRGWPPVSRPKRRGSWRPVGWVPWGARAEHVSHCEGYAAAASSWGALETAARSLGGPCGGRDPGVSMAHGRGPAYGDQLDGCVTAWRVCEGEGGS